MVSPLPREGNVQQHTTCTTAAVSAAPVGMLHVGGRPLPARALTAGEGWLTAGEAYSR